MVVKEKIKFLEDQILVSVIMSVFNEPIVYVGEAIQSILNQTLSEFEFIIVLDNPDYVEMLEYLKLQAMEDARLVLIVNEKNIGLAASLNRGIKIAKGQYLARMDADDISKPNRLEKQLIFIDSYHYDMVSCLVDKIDDTGETLDTLSPVPDSEQYISKMLPIQNVIVHPTVMIKLSVIKELNGYRLFPVCQDYDLWLRMLSAGYKIHIMNENLFCFRRHNNSITFQKRYMQVLNEKYIRNLYKERISGEDKDTYSENDLRNFLISRRAENERKISFENQCFQKYQKGLKLIRNHQIVRAIGPICSSLRGFSVRESIKTSLHARRIKRQLLNG